MFDLSLDELQKYGPIMGFLGTIIGLVFTGLQVRKNTQIQRADFLLELANGPIPKKG